MFNGRNARQTYVNIWSLFSKSFTPMVWHFTGFAIGMMLNFWVTNQHLWTCDDICIINTSIQIYSLLISTIQYLYPHIYISCTSACPSSSRAGRVSHVAEFRYGKRRLEERPRQRSSGITQIVLAPNM